MVTRRKSARKRHPCVSRRRHISKKKHLSKKRRLRKKKHLSKKKHLRKRRRIMSGGGEWEASPNGDTANDQLQWEKVPKQRAKYGDVAFFKHQKKMDGGQVWSIKLNKHEEGIALVGFASEDCNRGVAAYDKVDDGKKTVTLAFPEGSVTLGANLYDPEKRHWYPSSKWLGAQFPKSSSPPPATPGAFELALSINNNIPQVKFHNEREWRDLVPKGETGDDVMKYEGDWFPYLRLAPGDVLSDMGRFHRKRTKTAAIRPRANDDSSVAGPVGMLDMAAHSSEDGTGPVGRKTNRAKEPGAGSLERSKIVGRAGPKPKRALARSKSVGRAKPSSGSKTKKGAKSAEHAVKVRL